MYNKDTLIPNEPGFIDVETGEVKVAKDAVSLRSLAIGSCIVAAVFDRSEGVGGLAHIMLPGRSLKANEENKTKYAEDAIDDLLKKLEDLGVKREALKVNLIGGADVIAQGDVPVKLVNSVLGYLRKSGIRIVRQRLGGTQRRSIILDTGTGRMFFTEGDGAEKEL